MSPTPRATGLPCLVAVAWLAATPAPAAQDDGRSFETLDGAEAVAFAVELPEGFDPERAYPVLIGPGEGKPGAERSYFWRTERPARFGWILVETHGMFGPSGAEVTGRLLDRLAATHRVEGFHLVGYSANSAFVFDVAEALGARIASVTGVPGHPRGRTAAGMGAPSSTVVQMIVGEHDGYWRREAEQAEKRLRRSGVDVRLEVVPDGGHFLDGLIGEGLIERMERLRPRQAP